MNWHLKNELTKKKWINKKKNELIKKKNELIKKKMS